MLILGIFGTLLTLKLLGLTSVSWFVVFIPLIVGLSTDIYIYLKK